MSLKFAPYVLKSLWGHRARTLLTVSGSAVALLVFGLIQASQRGLENYAAAISKIPGVREVVPAQVFVNNCRASLDLVPALREL